MREPPEFAKLEEGQDLRDWIRGPDVHGTMRTFVIGSKVLFHLPDGGISEDIVVGCFIQPAFVSEEIPSCVLSKHTWAPTVNLEVLT